MLLLSGSIASLRRKPEVALLTLQGFYYLFNAVEVWLDNEEFSEPAIFFGKMSALLKERLED